MTNELLVKSSHFKKSYCFGMRQFILVQRLELFLHSCLLNI
jgi:hypothetical protein